MTSERIRDLLKAEPFQRFIVHLADGREIPVTHREFMAVGPSGRTATVHQPDDSLNIVDLLRVTDLEMMRQTRSRRRNGGRRS